MLKLCSCIQAITILNPHSSKTHPRSPANPHPQAYIQRETEQENWDINGQILTNFLTALSLAGTFKSLKRIILTLGAKQYGLHLGPTKLPMEETYPRVDTPDRPPNFYYKLQDVLSASQNKHKTWDWVVTYPNDVIGFARGNFMNLSTALALYASVTKELGEPFIFPGNERFYMGFDSFTASSLLGDFSVWAALEPRCGGEAFNIVNGDVDSWQTLWPRMARRWGVEVPEDMFGLEAPVGGMVTELHENPPIMDAAAGMGLKGRVQRGVVETRVDLEKWAQRKEVREAWEMIAEREGVDKEAFGKATWGFLGFVLGRKFDIVVSMRKARRFGWTGYKDTWEALEETFAELEAERVVPRVK